MRSRWASAATVAVMRCASAAIFVVSASFCASSRSTAARRSAISFSRVVATCSSALDGPGPRRLGLGAGRRLLGTLLEHVDLALDLGQFQRHLPLHLQAPEVALLEDAHFVEAAVGGNARAFDLFAGRDLGFLDVLPLGDLLGAQQPVALDAGLVENLLLLDARLLDHLPGGQLRGLDLAPAGDIARLGFLLGDDARFADLALGDDPRALDVFVRRDLGMLDVVALPDLAGAKLVFALDARLFEFAFVGDSRLLDFLARRDLGRFQRPLPGDLLFSRALFILDAGTARPPPPGTPGCAGPPRAARRAWTRSRVPG
ncbi:MAG: hypothetical protein M5U09_01345 [Gammaproteobacteria bacterium]|nr:hypothetical protein [Gammaproteobacteria bacterium]